MARTAPTPTAILDAIRSSGVVAILRARDASRFADITWVLVDAGVTSLEFTLTSDGALEALRLVAPDLPPGVSIGAGTVTTVEEADAAIDAGAQYLVAPALVPDVVRRARERNVAAFPGALTPTEIHAAWRAHATAVKVFPAASVGGPAYIKNVRGPFPDIPLVPTGGIGVDDAAGYIAAGALAVGIGGPLLGDAGAGGDLRALRERARRLVSAVGEALDGRR